jgi:hypothetical protein
MTGKFRSSKIIAGNGRGARVREPLFRLESTCGRITGEFEYFTQRVRLVNMILNDQN